MLQNYRITEKLILEHQRQLVEKADRIRQVQDAQHAPEVRRKRRVLAKLRAEMHNL